MPLSVSSPSECKGSIGNHVLIDFIELDLGQLIKDPFFTLFESVGALEVSLEYLTWLLLGAEAGRLWIERWIAATSSLERRWKMNLTSLKICSQKRLLA